jgi:hypothetical protein
MLCRFQYILHPSFPSNILSKVFLNIYISNIFRIFASLEQNSYLFFFLVFFVSCTCTLDPSVSFHFPCMYILYNSLSFLHFFKFPSFSHMTTNGRNFFSCIIQHILYRLVYLLLTVGKKPFCIVPYVRWYM